MLTIFVVHSTTVVLKKVNDKNTKNIFKEYVAS